MNIEQAIELDAQGVATIDGNPVAKYSVVETHRLDVKRAREILPQQVLDLLEVITPSRRFVLVEGDE